MNVLEKEVVMAWKLSESPASDPESAYKFVRAIGHRLQEDFVVLALNSQHKVIGKPILAARGTAASVEVHPRDVFREAIRRNAVAVVLAHNHPSVDLKPSENDRVITARMKSCGDLIGVPVLDHLIVGRNDFVSFAERGEL